MNRHLFKYRQSNFFFRGLGKLFSCRWILSSRRFLYRFLPFLRMESQATDTVYMSWLVDIEHIKDRFPESVQLWEKDGKTIFSILFYQHHHFGLHYLGPFRKLFPSPKQSNWRFYLAESLVPNAVIFEQIVVNNMLYVFGGRLLSDEMPAQYDPNIQNIVIKNNDGKSKDNLNADMDIYAQITMDETYRLEVHLQNGVEKQLDETWSKMFQNWDEAINFLVPKEHVWVEHVDQPNNLSQADIRIDANLESIEALKIIDIECPLFKELGITKDQSAFCFFIPNLDFHVLNEIPLTPSS